MTYLIRTGIFLLILIVVILILPNILNGNEKKHYSDENRLQLAKEKYHENSIGDSVTLVAGNYYDNKSSLHYKLFGRKYRKLWNTPVNVAVFSLKDSTDSYSCHDIGGGDQTINIELKDQEGKVWTLRSIDKDQSKALHPYLRKTILRPIIRDEVSAMNPFGAFVAAELAEAAGLLHTNPRLVFVPYIEEMRDSCRLKMAGRLALLEEETDKDGWSNNEKFLNAEAIVDSDDMFADLALNTHERSIDTLLFLKTRLFDILIADWDRHDGQWTWALKDGVYHPLPIDRDMTFYLFDDGSINRMVLLFNNKFRSFHPEFDDITGFVYNSKELDLKILEPLNEDDFLQQAEILQEELTNEEIHKSMKRYPAAVYEKVGQSHAETLIQRKQKLKIAAKEFFAAIQEVEN